MNAFLTGLGVGVGIGAMLLVGNAIIIVWWRRFVSHSGND